MRTDAREVVEAVFSDVLGRLGFMFAEPAEQDYAPAPANDYLLARVAFQGPFSGALLLAAPSDLCLELSSNMLGMEPAPENSAIHGDALKELLNVTCGNVLVALAGEEPVFDLSPPEVAELSRDDWEALVRHTASSLLVVEDEPILLHLYREGEATS